MNNGTGNFTTLFSYDWRSKLLVRLNNTGLWDVNELIEKATQLEHYFFNGEYANYAPQSPEEHITTIHKIRMTGIHLRSGCNDVDKIIEVVENSKAYLLDHLIEKVKGKSIEEINALIEPRANINSFMIP
ncbi:hypothetical protein AVENLUH5627_02459 [Acinetobacter venetianus]|uniref:Uncharacterized protein n=1 Tax=Acinetobacter venetianus TaxID=52133 RepID=A0A150HM82_9GAMM|nr:hypothetical protein [Acinetobacter venetianus]KXZ66765.1 hypothetical protein AVENLUH5627_02459 [Acinetobacter venetianus]